MFDLIKNVRITSKFKRKSHHYGVQEYTPNINDKFKLNIINSNAGGSVNFSIYNSKDELISTIRHSDSIDFLRFLETNSVVIENGYLVSHVVTDNGLVERDRFIKAKEDVEKNISELIDKDYFNGQPAITARKLSNGVYMYESGRVYYLFKVVGDKYKFNDAVNKAKAGFRSNIYYENKWYEIEVMKNSKGELFPISPAALRKKDKIIGKYPNVKLCKSLDTLDKITYNYL